MNTPSNELLEALHGEICVFSIVAQGLFHLQPFDAEDIGEATFHRIHRQSLAQAHILHMLEEPKPRGQYVRATYANLVRDRAKKRNRTREVSEQAAFALEAPGVWDPAEITQNQVDEARHVVNIVRAKLSRGGRADSVLNLFIRGTPIPKGGKRRFREGLMELKDVAIRALRSEFHDLALPEFLHSLRLAQLAPTTDRRALVLERPQLYRLRHGERKYRSLLSRLSVDAHLVVEDYAAGSSIEAIVTGLARKYCGEMTDDPSRADRRPAFLELRRHVEEVGRTFWEPHKP